jgi:hypothetical protein
VLAAALIVRVPHVAAGHDAGTAVKIIGVLLWSAASALYLVLAVVTAMWSVRTRRRPGYQASTWVIVFPLGMYAVASWQLGAVAGLTLIREVGTIAVWPAALAWTLTGVALIVSAGSRAAGARSGRQRAKQRPYQSYAGHPAAMQRYKFEALVTITQPGEDPVAAVPGADWRGVLRAGTDGTGSSPSLFSALVHNWDLHDSGRVGDGRALATIVAFGPQPADCLPVGSTFALWRGRDVAHGVVTRRLFV